MNVARIVSIIVGIIMTVAGVIFLFRPGTTFATLIFILGIVLIFSSITSMVNYFSVSSGGRRNVWTLITAILSLIAGILLISNHFANFFTSVVILYVLAIGILVKGILQVAEALTVKSMVGGMGMGSSALLVIGLFLIVAGIIFIISPGLLMGFISTAVSLLLIVGGISVLAAGLSMPIV